jgi:hypothetical protein
MAATKEPPTGEAKNATITGSDGTTVEMVVIDGVRYRADDPMVAKLRKPAENKTRSGGATK